MPVDEHDGLSDRLLDVLVDLAVAMTAEPPVASLLGLVVEQAAEALPVDGVGVCLCTISSPVSGAADPGGRGSGCWCFYAGSGAGPGRLSGTIGAAVLIPDLLVDDRSPGCPVHDAAANVDSAFRFPLRYDGAELGALNLYRTDAVDLHPAESAAAQTLARVIAAYLVSIRHRVERQETSDLSQQQALHDPLTGLPNRTLMLERLQHALERSRRTGRVVAVLYLDLDGFKAINDTFGHAVGDELLIAVTIRLASLLRPPDTLARLHGDEFVLLCEDLTDRGQAVQICRRLQEALNAPLLVNHVHVALRASVGVVVTDADTDDPAAVLGDADLAMYEAKRRGGAQFWVHTAQPRT